MCAARKVHAPDGEVAHYSKRSFRIIHHQSGACRQNVTHEISFVVDFQRVWGVARAISRVARNRAPSSACTWKYRTLRDGGLPLGAWGKISSKHELTACSDDTSSRRRCDVSHASSPVRRVRRANSGPPRIAGRGDACGRRSVRFPSTMACGVSRGMWK